MMMLMVLLMGLFSLVVVVRSLGSHSSLTLSYILVLVFLRLIEVVVVLLAEYVVSASDSWGEMWK